MVEWVFHQRLSVLYKLSVEMGPGMGVEGKGGDGENSSDGVV
jgi:hypothetical protein